MVCCAFLNGANHVLLCFLVGLFLDFLLHFFYEASSFQFYIIFNNSQQMFFCLFRGQSGNSFQLLHTLFVEFGNGFFFLCQALFLRSNACLSLLDSFCLAIDILFLLLDPAFVSLNFCTTILYFSVEFILRTNGFFLKFEHSFPLLGFSFLDGVINDFTRTSLCL